jgi:hypothetical protein
MTHRHLILASLLLTATGMLVGCSQKEAVDEATAAFDVLVDGLIALQRDGLVRPEDPRALAQFIWATVHGVAMLSIDGQLGPNPSPSADALSRFALDRLEAAIGLTPGP